MRVLRIALLFAVAIFFLCDESIAQRVRNVVTPQLHKRIHALGIVGFSSADCSAETCTSAELNFTCAETTTYWLCNGAGTWTQIGGAGGGDVSGPSPSTDNALVRFDGPTGKLIQDYTSDAVTASDTGDFAVVTGKRINLEGATGDTYQILDDDTNTIRAFVDATRSTQTRADQWIPPPCPADLSTVAFGGVCTEAATGKIRYRGILEAIP